MCCRLSCPRSSRRHASHEAATATGLCAAAERRRCRADPLDCCLARAAPARRRRAAAALLAAASPLLSDPGGPAFEWQREEHRPRLRGDRTAADGRRQLPSGAPPSSAPGTGWHVRAAKPEGRCRCRCRVCRRRRRRRCSSRCRRCCCCCCQGRRVLVGRDDMRLSVVAVRDDECGECARAQETSWPSRGAQVHPPRRRRPRPPLPPSPSLSRRPGRRRYRR